MKKIFLIILIAEFFLLSGYELATEAHPGRLDSNGGHTVHTSGWGYPVGSYHYHQGPNASGSSKKSTPPSKKYSSMSERKRYGQETLREYKRWINPSFAKSKTISFKDLPIAYEIANIIPLPSSKSDLPMEIQLVTKDDSPWEGKREDANLGIR